jgi:CheY-like chemotaxis protein
VKQLVELHGGSNTAKSPAREMGSTFRVTLPLMATAEDPRGLTGARLHPASSGWLPDYDIQKVDLKGLKILVVDDELDASSLIQRLLQDCNANVMTASSVDEALQLLSRASVDLLVSDIGMSVKDGFELMRCIRSLNDHNAVIPAIALTAYARIEDRVKAIQAGFQVHLAKPVGPIELIAVVESLARSAGSTHRGARPDDPASLPERD